MDAGKMVVLQNEFATQNDLQRLRREMESSSNTHDMRDAALQNTKKIIRGVSKGLAQVNKSTHTAAPGKHRPKIADISWMGNSDVTKGYDLNMLKDPKLRNRDIRGRRKL